jgi:hemoglobin/transferrin/lactoferrin receptor protein
MASLSFGARYDHYDFETITGRDIASSKFSPNLALTLEPTDELTFVASYSQAYRGVGIREAFLPGDRAAAADGEEAETFKFTAKYERDGFFVSGTYFDQSIDNYLYPIASGRGGPNGSFGDIESDGYEFRVGFRRGGFSTSLAVADNSPDVRGYDYIDDLGVVVAGRRWILDSSYAFEESGITVGANIEHREEVDEVPLGRFPSVAGKNSYTLVNAFISWEVSQVEGLTISVNADNLFDKQYQDHTIYTASGFASPGREVRLGASYQF